MPRFADMEYYRLAKREEELLAEIERLNDELEGVQQRLRNLEDDHHIDAGYIRRMWEAGI